MEYPKTKRRSSSDEIRYVREKRDKYCMVGSDRMGRYGACSDPGHEIHHIRNQGAGGDDDRRNLIKLCRRHHNLAQAHVIPREELYAILQERYHYEYP